MTYHRYLKSIGQIPDLILFNIDRSLEGEYGKYKYLITIKEVSGLSVFDHKTSDTGIHYVCFKIDNPKIILALKNEGYLEKYYPNLDIGLKINTLTEFVDFINNTKSVVLRDWEFLSNVSNPGNLYHPATNEELEHYKYLNAHRHDKYISEYLFFFCDFFVPCNLSIKNLILLDPSISNNYAIIRHETLYSYNVSLEQKCSLRIGVKKDSPLYDVLFRHGYINKFYPKL